MGGRQSGHRVGELEALLADLGPGVYLCLGHGASLTKLCLLGPGEPQKQGSCESLPSTAQSKSAGRSQIAVTSGQLSRRTYVVGSGLSLGLG